MRPKSASRSAKKSRSPEGPLGAKTASASEPRSHAGSTRVENVMESPAGEAKEATVAAPRNSVSGPVPAIREKPPTVLRLSSYNERCIPNRRESRRAKRRRRRMRRPDSRLAGECRALAGSEEAGEGQQHLCLVGRQCLTRLRVDLVGEGLELPRLGGEISSFFGRLGGVQLGDEAMRDAGFRAVEAR